MKQELIDYMVMTVLERIRYTSKIEPSDEVNLLENRLGYVDLGKIEKNIREAKRFVEAKKGQKLGKIQYILYPVDKLNQRFGRPTSFFRAGLGRYDDKNDIFHLSDRCVHLQGLVHEITHKYQNETG